MRVRSFPVGLAVASTALVPFPLSAADLPAVAPAPRPSVAADPVHLRTLAAAAEQEGRWDAALDLYLRLYVGGQQTLEVRDRVRHCLRYANQVRRHRDPAFQQFVASLPVADALNLYAEVVGTLGRLYADRDRAAPARLFAFGLDEFDRAVGDPSFRRRHMDVGSEGQVRGLREAVRDATRRRTPTTVREARLALREVVSAAQRAGFRDGSVVVCEFLCGACAGLDEFTAYVPPSDAVLDKPTSTVLDTGVIPMKEAVGYIRLASFRETTPRELDDAMLSLLARGVRAVIIDVRGNPGGLFTAAVHVAQRFLPGGIIVTTQGPAPEFAGRVFSSDAGMAAYDLPVVLLVDARTMSAAEVVAAAWKENGRAVLVGQPTYGKGVVQAPVPLVALDNPATTATQSGVLVLTVANVFGPRGVSLQGAGVVPDVIVADPNQQLDAAVGKAVELLMTGGLQVPMPGSVVR